MERKSLRAQIEEAKKNAPVGASSGAEWESDTYDLEIVNARYDTQWDTPKIGMQCQRNDGRRRWFDLKFPEPDAIADADLKRKAQRELAEAGAKLSILLTDETLIELEQLYPDNVEQQYRAAADRLFGVKFKGVIAKVESNATKGNPDLTDAERTYRNFLNSTTLVSSPNATPPADTGLAGGSATGLMG